jgi:hypothetical protein
MTIHGWSGGLAFLVGAAIVAVAAIQLDVGTLQNPGPGLAPLLFAVSLGLLSTALVLTARGGTPLVVDVPWRRIAALLAVLAAWALAIETAGYLACTFLAAVCFVLIGRRPWYAALVFAVGATLVVEFVFVRWLATPLPRGTFF